MVIYRNVVEDKELSSVVVFYGTSDPPAKSRGIVSLINFVGFAKENEFRRRSPPEASTTANAGCTKGTCVCPGSRGSRVT